MAKMTIIEGNSNDKDNVRAYMVKGEKGYSAYDLYVQHGGTLTEEEWLDAFLNAENYYNKSETDTLLNNHYTKTESDNKYKLLGDFSLIEGTILLDANTSELQAQNLYTFTADTIDYPTGFTKTNCVVTAFGVVMNGYYDNKGYSFGDRSGSNVTSLIIAGSDVPRNAALHSDGIHISIGNYVTEALTFKYKIVLMKIS